MQTALQLRRECLREGNCKAAVAAAQEPDCLHHGSTLYLQELQKAYKGYVREPRLANRDADAKFTFARPARSSIAMPRTIRA